MRILLIHQFFMDENGTAGSRFNEMTRVWRENGAEITVIAGQLEKMGYSINKNIRNEYVYKVIQSNQVEVFRCHVSEGYHQNFLRRLISYFSFVISALYAGIFKIRNKFDVLVVTSPPLFVGITAYLLSRIKRIPMVFEIRDLWPESAIDTGVIKNKFIIRLSFFLEKFFYKKSALINVLTPAFKANLIEKKNVPAGKIVFVPNAADFAFSEKAERIVNVQSFREEIGWKDKVVFLYVGAHGVANHLIQVIDAAERTSNSEALFVLLGDGMQKQFLMDEIKKRKLKNVQLLPAVPKDQVFKYIWSSDVGMSVLKNIDTFKTVYSNKTFDYMSCKKPILMAIAGISKELVEDAGCGIYVEPENIEDYLKAIDYLCSNPTIRQQKGINGYNYAKQHFDREVLAHQYLNYINSLKN